MNDPNNKRETILSYISPDPSNPEFGLVRLSNSQIQYIACDEGFLEEPHNDSSSKYYITDEQRLVVRVMFNRHTSILLRKSGLEEKQIILYLHDDGIVAAENESASMVALHCFESIEDCVAYYINSFIPENIDPPVYPYKFLVPTDQTLYQEPHKFRFSEKIKALVCTKLWETDKGDKRRYSVETGYMNEWDNAKWGIHLLATTQKNEIGFLSFTICNDCIWGVYPEEKNYARVKVMGSTEAQNKFCEFIDSFSRSGGV